MKRVILVDADILAFRSTSSVQKDIDWGDGLWTCHAYLNDATFMFSQMWETICKKIKYDPDDDEVIMCLSDENNFRKIINPEYKANRRGHRKPTCYKGMVEWIKSYFKYKSMPYFEGDDVISYLASEYHDKGYEVWVVSGDKDFLTVPYVTFFDFLRDKVTKVSAHDAIYNLMYQVIIGDKADNYFGVPNYGPVKANRYLDKYPMNEFNATRQLFMNEGLSEQDFWFNYNMAKLINNVEFNPEDGRLVLNLGNGKEFTIDTTK